MSGEHIATITLTTGDDGVEAHVDTELQPHELGPVLQLIADGMMGQEPPRAAGAWGYRPDRK